MEIHSLGQEAPPTDHVNVLEKRFVQCFSHTIPLSFLNRS